jgi:hypothetical protein
MNKAEKKIGKGLRWWFWPLIILAVPPLVALALIVLIGLLLALIFLHFYAWVWWLPRGKTMLFIYSNSPNWQQDIEENVLPSIHDCAIIMNWSERKQWNTMSPAVWAFKIIGGERDFNPMAIIFRPMRIVRTVRFFQAYRAAKHGDVHELHALKKELIWRW